MLCERCRNELSPNAEVCLKCGTPVSRNVAGFENTIEIKRALKSMMNEHGQDIIQDSNKFVSLLRDYIPEYEKECRLLRNMLQSGVLANMMRESEQQGIAVMKAREFMVSEMFLSENAAEFVLVCFTYMLGWEYTSKLTEKPKAVSEQSTATGAGTPAKTPAQKKPPMPFDLDMKVFRPADAAKFRLKGSVKVPEGYTKLDSFAFDGFGFMKTIELPSTLVSIGEYAFSECKRLKSVDIPETVQVLKQGAFSQCGKLTVVKLPDGVFEIEDNTFSFCHSLEIIDVPESVSSIGREAFSGCEKLRKLFLSENVKFIDEGAFSYCTSLVIRCYENSYVHRYCMANGLNVETVAKGTPFSKLNS
ncbi:MAG: leucine-rich repeat domain-containing protein [Ruminococcus flavefaciens]|nr:leucine-rich repeat domain-containing protein [Ruminococcus flavefaciens]